HRFRNRQWEHAVAPDEFHRHGVNNSPSVFGALNCLPAVIAEVEEHAAIMLGDAHERRVALAPRNRPRLYRGQALLQSLLARPRLVFIDVQQDQPMPETRRTDRSVFAVLADRECCVGLVSVIVPKLDALDIAHELVALCRPPPPSSGTALIGFGEL